MSHNPSIVGSQVEALLKLLDRSRQEHCERVLENARSQAAEIRQRARRQARERIATTVTDERNRMDNAARMVTAEIETEQRRREQRRDQALIKLASGKLGQALEKRWHDSGDRQAWSEATLAEAAMVLRSREWTLEHPPDWSEAERDATLERGRDRFGATIKARSAGELSAGLRIHAQGVMVDMSLEGLLANQRIIEGELLAEFNRTAKEKTS
jgi:hypothetical protein